MKITPIYIERTVAVLDGRINYLLIVLKQSGRGVRAGSKQLCYLIKPYALEVIALKAARKILEKVIKEGI